MRWVLSIALLAVLSVSARGVEIPQSYSYYGNGMYFGGYSGMGVPPSIYTPVNVYVVPQWDTPYYHRSYHQPYYSRPVHWNSWP
jgi:hypothetical protein